MRLSYGAAPTAAARVIVSDPAVGPSDNRAPVPASIPELSIVCVVAPARRYCT